MSDEGGLLERDQAKRGTWARPRLAKRSHYFVDGESLCRGWIYRGEPSTRDSSVALPDDCGSCWHQLDRRRNGVVNARAARRPR